MRWAIARDIRKLPDPLAEFKTLANREERRTETQPASMMEPGAMRAGRGGKR